MQVACVEIHMGFASILCHVIVAEARQLLRDQGGARSDFDVRFTSKASFSHP